MGAVSDTFLNMWLLKQGSDRAVRAWMEYVTSLNFWMASIVMGDVLKANTKCTFTALSIKGKAQAPKLGKGL